MDATIFLARFLGGFYLIFGLLFIITRQLGKTIEMTENKSFDRSFAQYLGLGLEGCHYHSRLVNANKRHYEDRLS